MGFLAVSDLQGVVREQVTGQAQEKGRGSPCKLLGLFNAQDRM